jgi:excisionase family DNA binding protein
MKEYYTTSEVAKLCSVSRLTVINWTKKGLIPATTTAGGHRRIHKSELIKCMKSQGIDINTTGLDSPSIPFQWCWDYHKDEKWKNHKCRGCLVHLTNTKKCYVLRKKLGPERIFCKFNCDDCQYFKDYHQHFQWCWEFHQESGITEHKCQECLVFLSGIKKCYILREETEHKKIFCKSDCHDCDYYKKVVKE